MNKPHEYEITAGQQRADLVEAETKAFHGSSSNDESKLQQHADF